MTRIENVFRTGFRGKHDERRDRLRVWRKMYIKNQHAPESPDFRRANVKKQREKTRNKKFLKKTLKNTLVVCAWQWVCIRLYKHNRRRSVGRPKKTDSEKNWQECTKEKGKKGFGFFIFVTKRVSTSNESKSILTLWPETANSKGQSFTCPHRRGWPRSG